MKRLIVSFIAVFISSFAFTQDLITKKNGDQIKAKILEITSETIKYKDFDFLDGPIRNVNVSDVLVINYANGKKETYTNQLQQTQQPVENQEEPKRTYKGNYFMLGTGYGISYGGLGLRLQARFGGKTGVGFHGGVGYLPGYSVLAGGGIKFFPYKGLYIDTQFGLTGYESYTETYSGSYSYTNFDDNVLYGPSIMVGLDQVWGRKVGIGFNVALGASYNINAEYSSDIVPEIDMGFLIRF